MKTPRPFSGWLTLALLTLATGCVSTSTPPLVLEMVGPTSGGTLSKTPKGDGFLQVFSDTDTSNSGGISYYLHSGYEVRDESGKPLRYIRNHGDNTDQAPEMVKLPVGHYRVSARCPGYGLVEVPVLVVREDPTVVNLENRGQQPPADGEETVRLPNGWPVGRRAKVPAKP